MSEEKPQKPRCRFDLFVRIRPGIPSRFKDQKRTWCYRGDKYTDIEAQMLRSLITLLNKNLPECDLFELYDNYFPRDQEERLIVKILDGIVVVNRLRLPHYQDLLTSYAIPDFLK